ncbi:hypothetical protein XELAEV_18000362mg [Xenopus laevis]|uniref:Uncharacterized protein n=1 Tax=Xenopus laevis TaxID=8355 RepID=A0A974GZG3_XENLA|nr:hypothetical protein XELAEV_18000362mg [Xenopus laevis]
MLSHQNKRAGCCSNHCSHTLKGFSAVQLYTSSLWLLFIHSPFYHSQITQLLLLPNLVKPPTSVAFIQESIWILHELCI